MTNILITSAGRRDILVRYFKRSIGDDGLVLAADRDWRVPSLSVADRGFVVPGVFDSDYIDSLLDICGRYDVKAVVPIIDTDCVAISREKKRFEDAGVIPVVSDSWFVETSCDKWASDKLFRETGFETPKTWLATDEAEKAIERGELNYPFVLKPRWGWGSIGVTHVYAPSELSACRKMLVDTIQRDPLLYEMSRVDMEHAILYQERFEGDSFEFASHILCDLSGRFVTATGSRVLSRGVGNEAYLIETIDDPVLKDIGRKFAEVTRPVFSVGLSLFRRENRYYASELNPRITGGFPFLQESGQDWASVLVAWFRDEPINPEWLETRPAVVTGIGYTVNVSNTSLKEGPNS